MRAFALRSIAGCLLGMGLSGCGPSAPYETIPINGTVTYEDGTPIPAPRVTIAFESEAAPIDAKTHPRTGRAEVKADGSFDSVTTWKAGDGAIVGKHKVVVTSRDKQENPTRDVPSDYTNKLRTPLTVDIQPGSSPLNIKIRKPTP